MLDLMCLTFCDCETYYMWFNDERAQTASFSSCSCCLFVCLFFVPTQFALYERKLVAEQIV